MEAEVEPILRAVLNRIIPEDDYPSAWDAGCGVYIDRLLDRELAGIRDAYVATLLALNKSAAATLGKPFVDLKSDDQDVFLRRVENGGIGSDWPIPGREFFNLIVNHTAEGYYSDPGNGGNRDFVGWRMVGFIERSASL